MTKLHIANTNFEYTYELNYTDDLKSSFYLHEVFLQLQFLPLLYAKEEDTVLVTDFPSSIYQKKIEKIRGFCPKMILMNQKIEQPYNIEPWGHHPLIEKWALQHHLPYRTPNPTLMRTIASKEFTFQNAPKLRGSCLIHCREEVDFTNLPIVLKSPLGFAGRGHKILYKKEVLPPFQGTLIQEPWVDVEQNFSSQYVVDNDEIVCLGRTPIENTKKGSYLATCVIPLTINPEWIHEHHKFSLSLLSDLQSQGFFGNVGIDAFIYRENCQSVLHPIVEINPRKTMSYVALEFLQNKEGILSMTKSINSTSNLLPDHLECREKTFYFKKGLTVTYGHDRNQGTASTNCWQQTP